MWLFLWYFFFPETFLADRERKRKNSNNQVPQGIVIDVMKGLSIELVAPRGIMLAFVRKMPKSVIKHYKALSTTYITLLL